MVVQSSPFPSGSLAERRDRRPFPPLSFAASNSEIIEKLQARRYSLGVNDTQEMRNLIRDENTVRLSSGTFLVDDNLVLRSNTTIEGAGIDRTIIQVRNTSTRMREKGLLALTTLSVVHIRNLTLDGNKANNVNGKYSGIMVAGSSLVFIENVKCINFPDDDGTGTLYGDGMQFTENGAGTRSTYCWVTNCIADANVRVNFLVSHAAHVFFTNCVGKSATGTNVGDGFYVEAPAGDTTEDIHFDNCAAIDNARRGFNIADSSGTILAIFLDQPYASGNSGIADYNFGGVATGVIVIAPGPQAAVFNLDPAALTAGSVQFHEAANVKTLAAGTNLTITRTDSAIFITTGGGANNALTLPTALHAILGRRYTFYVTAVAGGRTAVVNRAGGDLIVSGATATYVSVTLDTVGDFVELQAVGNNRWLALASFGAVFA